jgi:hypothetical protein
MMDRVVYIGEALNPLGKSVFFVRREGLTIYVGFMTYSTPHGSTYQSPSRCSSGYSSLIDISVGSIYKVYECLSEVLLFCGLGDGFQLGHSDVDRAFAGCRH